MALGDSTNLVEGTDFVVRFGLIWFEQKDLLEQINTLAYCGVRRLQILNVLLVMAPGDTTNLVEGIDFWSHLA
jgi:hypothetical protein